MFSLTRLAARPIFQKRSYLSSTPRNTTGSHQTAGSSPAPRGISPLAWFSRNRPHCLRRITAANRFNARTLGWTGVSLRCWSWPYREPPGTGSLLFLAPCWEEQTKDLQFLFFGGVSLFSPGRSPRSRYLGFGFRQSSGNVLDEWVCSFQGAVRP